LRYRKISQKKLGKGVDNPKKGGYIKKAPEGRANETHPARPTEPKQPNRV
jgi:hypothetical protein